MRRSVATGCWRASRSIDSASSSLAQASSSLSASMTDSASWMSASSRAVVARDMAEPARRVISTSWSEIVSRSSWKASRMCIPPGVGRWLLGVCDAEAPTRA